MIKKIGSIRRFLLVNLLTAMIITTLATSLGNFYLDQRDIHRHLDNVLKQTAHSFISVLGSGQFIEENVERIQENINHAFNRFQNVPLTQFYANQILPNYEFQIFNKNNQLILHSLHAPTEPLTNIKQGFSTQEINHHIWRSYVETDSKTHIRFIVAEKDDLRNILMENMLLDDFYILLIMYPAAVLIIWFIVGIALKSVDDIAHEVSHRLPNYLKPVDLSFAPKEIKPLVLEVNHLFKRLQQAFDREKRFAADAAHELKTPLAAIKTQAQVAIREAQQAETIQTYQHIITAVDRMSHIVQQLLTLNRLTPDNDNSKEQMTDVNLYRIAAEIIASLVPTALEKNIELELLHKDENLNFLGHPTGLGVLIRNLVDNAIRYSHPYSKIQIVIEKNHQVIILKVIDQGPGIPEELRDRVFERFYRILGNTSPGSGLGLAIVRQIADLHQAEVILKTPEAGQGLEVQVWFPIIIPN